MCTYAIVMSNIFSRRTVFPCTGMHCLKTRVLGNRRTIKHALRYIFIRIHVGYTVQYIDILKSYSN